jgi:hypothetical protein
MLSSILNLTPFKGEPLNGVPPGLKPRACSLDIFSCVFPIARRANREQPRASAWLKPWEPNAQGNRPERAAESTLTTTYGYVVVIFDAPIPFPPDCARCHHRKFSYQEELRELLKRHRVAFRRTFSLGIMPGTRTPFQGDSLGDVFPGLGPMLFCFRPLGDAKCPNCSPGVETWLKPRG